MTSRGPSQNRPGMSPGGFRPEWTSALRPNRCSFAGNYGGPKGRQPKLSVKQQKELRRMHGTGDYTITDLAELFKVSRATVYTHTGRTELAYDTHVAGVVSVRPAPSVALFCTGWTGDPQGPTAPQATQAQTRSGGAPRRAVARGKAHRRRTRLAVLRCPLYRLPGLAEGWRAEASAGGSPSVSSQGPDLLRCYGDPSRSVRS